MMRSVALAAVLLSSAMAPILCAQQPADFSGRWTVEAAPAPSAPAGGVSAAPDQGDMGSGWGSTMTITQDAKQIAVEYVIYSRYDLQPPLTFTYALDGSESRNTVMVGRGAQTESSRASWNGSRLTITTTYSAIDPRSGAPFSARLTRTLSLEDPATLVVNVARDGVLGGPASMTHTIYKKG